MLRHIARSLVPWLLVASCTGPRLHEPLTAEDHERLARHYEATAQGIERECWKDRRHELTVVDPHLCWKAQDRRFLEANLDAAAQHRAAAQALERARSSPPMVATP